MKARTVFLHFLGVIILTQIQAQPIQINSNLHGVVSYQSNLNSEFLHFYIYNDGYYAHQMSPTHGYVQSQLGHKTEFYFVDNKQAEEPELYSVPTGATTDDGTSVNLPLHMRPNIDPTLSWNITNYAETFILLNFENKFSSSNSSGCITFEYNEDQLGINFNKIRMYNDWVSDMTLGNNSITWNYEKLAPEEQRVIYIPVIALIESGNAVEYSGSLYPGCQDFAITTDVIEVIDLWPHDPNGLKVINTKYLSHSQALDHDFNETEQVLRYKVDFSNIGTGPAQHITVTDLFSGDFNPSSCVFIEASHDAEQISPGEFYFENIFLPGTGQNVPKHLTEAWLIFEVCMVEYISNGECIDNTVEIVFDTQAPMTASDTICALVADPVHYGNPCSKITKKDQLTIREKSEQSKNYKEPRLYPNPVTQQLTLLNDYSQLVNIDIFDFRGTKVFSAQESNSALIQMDLSVLNTGIYYAQITMDGKVINKKIIKI